MKIGLLHPKTQSTAKATLIWPPLGLCRIAKTLQLAGHTVTIIEDALKNLSLDEILHATSQLDVLGIGAMTLQSRRTEEIITAIRAASTIPIVCGGPHYSSTRILPPGATALVVGDGETAFLDVIAGKDGIIYGKPAKDYINVDFSLINYSKYGDHLIDGTRAISLLTARGCPFDCKFCGSPAMFGRCVTSYPLQLVVDNMRELSEKYNISAFRIMDDTFTISQKRVSEFCDIVKQYHWRMSCLTNIKTINLETLQQMKSAGFEFIAIGAESADQTVLMTANKHQTADEITEAVSIINDAGLKAEVLFMIGLPNETAQSLEKTIEFSKKLKAFRVHAQFFTPFPGCEFYDALPSLGKIIEQDQSTWTHRIPVFVPNTISDDDLARLGTEFIMLTGREVGK